MINNPKVTVITPAYNCAQYLKETIESVLNQCYENLEYIIINDGSTDETDELLKDYQNEETIKYVSLFCNQGEQRTVTRGLHLVTGKYFMIVNADDPLYPNAIENMVRYMECNPQALCAYPDWDVIDEQGKVSVHVQTREYNFPWMVAHQNCIPGVGSIFRSNIIQWVGYRDESFKWLGDYDFWLRIGLAGQMLHVPMTLARWRNHTGQLSKAKSDLRAKEHIRVYTEFYQRNDIPKPIRKVERTAKAWSYLIAATLTPDKLRTWLYIFTALRYDTMLFSVSFWDALIRRALYILRR